MKKLRFIHLQLTIVFCMMTNLSINAESLAEINNYRQYNDFFASAGQPTKKQLQLLAKSGVELVIYLAYTDNESAVTGEDRLVKKLGMNYLHIAIDYEKPTLLDYQLFSAVMSQSLKINTFLHCQINLRASVFSFLYRTITLKIPIEKAKQSLDSVWEPNKVWFEFIKDTLNHYNIDYDCADCDWGANALMAE